MNEYLKVLPKPVVIQADIASSFGNEMPLLAAGSQSWLEMPKAITKAGTATSAEKLCRLARLSRVADCLGKRTVDVGLSMFLLLTTSPIFLLLAVMVSLDGGNVFFVHERVGRGLRPFRCLKFRTMIPNAEATLFEYLALNPEAAEEWSREHKLAVDIRVTPVGRLLRRLSLDELPQLWNVLRGEMSLVGPRPITQQETARYGSSLTQYASVRPGLTGLWQVSGRNEVTYEGRVTLDTAYVETRTLQRDLSILFLRTPLVLLSRRGAR